MLLRSIRVTEKNFGSRSSRKEQFCVAAKAVKNVHSSTQSFQNMVAKINILTVVQMWLLKLTSEFSNFKNN